MSDTPTAPEPTPTEAPASSRLVRHQFATVALLAAGYTGYYFCRSNFPVCSPMIQEELATRGMTLDQAKLGLGSIITLGALAYSAGKFLGGGITDRLGGSRIFLAGMLGSILCTIAFTFGGSLPFFTIAAVGNRFMQSLGWVGVVRVVSRWFPHRKFGTVMGFVSLSYLFGDALSRKFMKILLDWDFSWRGVYFATAGVLGVMFVVNLFLLRESPADVGEPEPQANPDNLFGAEGSKAEARGLWDVVGPLLRSRVFVYACMLSIGLTLLRETFQNWTPIYFTEDLHLTAAEAADKSAWFPFFGGISVLLVGFLSDKLGRGGRALVIVVGLLAAAVALMFLAMRVPHGTAFGPEAVVALIGFLLVGPYSFLAGAVALDFGGKKGAAAAAGIIDGVSYIGAMLSGLVMAQISVKFGWSGAFAVLAFVALATGGVALTFYLDQRRRLSI
ncbi:MFS transporter [Paludisphaera mucosa]|uniref:MFS transporter n=1 Tax=Paludisphaera mucosa TaxID=3030827 RepID=A0ABT6FG09_9BACT|nr:MFS transporter [Paludisphaera mucosa]MDG3006516.1 MFS transporter [Paludisphaera mucosa]